MGEYWLFTEVVCAMVEYADAICLIHEPSPRISPS